MLRSRVELLSTILILPALCVITHSADSGVESRDSARFLLINKQNWDSIKTVELEFERIEDRYSTQAEVDMQEEQMRLRIESVKKDKEYSEAEKNYIIPQYENSFKYIFGVMEEHWRLRNRLWYDTGVGKYRLDRDPVLPEDWDENRPAGSTKAYRSTFIVGEGKRSEYLLDKNYAISGSQDDPTRRPVEPYLGVIGTKDIEGFEFVASSENTVDGYGVIVYEYAKPGRNIRKLIYADPNLGYRFRRVEVYSGGSLRQMIEAKNYRFFGEIPLPTLYEKVAYRNDSSRPIISRDTVKVTNAVFNVPLDTSLFEAPLKKGTRVFNEDLKMDLVLEEDAGTERGGVQLQEFVEEGLTRRLDGELIRESRTQPEEAEEKDAKPAPRTLGKEATDTVKIGRVAAFVIAVLLLLTVFLVAKKTKRR